MRLTQMSEPSRRRMYSSVWNGLPWERRGVAMRPTASYSSSERYSTRAGMPRMALPTYPYISANLGLYRVIRRSRVKTIPTEAFCMIASISWRLLRNVHPGRAPPAFLTTWSADLGRRPAIVAERMGTMFCCQSLREVLEAPRSRAEADGTVSADPSVGGGWRIARRQCYRRGVDRR